MFSKVSFIKKIIVIIIIIIMNSSYFNHNNAPAHSKIGGRALSFTPVRATLHAKKYVGENVSGP